jgi:hypothetical protein
VPDEPPAAEADKPVVAGAVVGVDPEPPPGVAKAAQGLVPETPPVMEAWKAVGGEC